MDKLYYEEYYHLERTHWWFKARSDILESLIRHMAEYQNPMKILNVGAATGASSHMLSQFGEVISVEYNGDCYRFLKNLPGINAIQASCTDLPFKDESFDLVCALDVLEHIEDDRKALEEINRVMKVDGISLITVPALNFLWSKHDEINHHYRRYSLKLLKQKLKESKLQWKFVSYYNFFLFIPILIIRKLSQPLNYMTNDSASTTGSDFEKFASSNILNRLLFHIFKSEMFILRRCFPLPIGISIIAIIEKKP